MIVLFTILTKGAIVTPNNLQLQLSQMYMLMIASIGVFFVITVICLVVAFFFFRYTSFGANLKAIGASERGARFAGIKVTKTKFLVYVLAGVITGFAAFINAIKVLSVTSTGGNQLETQILIGLVLGGMPISGGAKVRFSNIVVGVLMYRFMATGLVMVGLTTQMQQLIQGIVFVVMVTLFSDRKSLAVIK